MTFFLVFMVLAFVVNLLWAGPDWPAALKGAFIPRVPEGADWLTLGGLVATTFVMVAAFFQAYLVRAKGWKEEDLSSGVTDTVLASILYTAIGCVIMMTAAAVLYPGGSVDSAAGMAMQLEGVFGSHARIIFCIGFGTAAFSSFVTNALIGGVLVSDGLGLGGKVNSPSTKLIAAIILLIGMATAVAILQSEAPADAAAAGSAAKSPVGDPGSRPGASLDSAGGAPGSAGDLAGLLRPGRHGKTSVVAAGTGLRRCGRGGVAGNRRHDGPQGGSDGIGFDAGIVECASSLAGQRGELDRPSRPSDRPVLWKRSPHNFLCAVTLPSTELRSRFEVQAGWSQLHPKPSDRLHLRSRESEHFERR